jgi:hypothetical protein
MKVDCQWFSSRLEAFFCESLGEPELQLASEHLKTCLTCRNEVQALQNVDPLVKQLLEFRMAKARAADRAPRRSLGFQLGLAAGGVALAGILVFAVFLRQTEAPNGLLPSIQTVLHSSGASDSGEGKLDGSIPTTRAKPDAPDQKSPSVKPGPEPAIPEGAPEFLVADAAGYSTSLQDYRGHVLLFGVWSADEPEAAQNLQRLYQAFGNRKEVRILGISSRNQERLAGTTFPMVFNSGSHLIETHISNFALIDKEGTVQMRGSLVGDSNALIPKIREKLDELGGR